MFVVGLVVGVVIMALFNTKAYNKGWEDCKIHYKFRGVKFKEE